MPCLVVLAVLAFPRIVILALFFLSTYIERAYHGYLVPLLGFCFLPITTLAYAWLVNTRTPIEGVYLLVIIAAVAIDVGGLGGGEYHRRRH